MTTFYLVRHGVTSHTGHRLTGWMEGVSLSDEGRVQAEAAADALSNIRLKAIYASPIDRTRETAEIIAARHRVDVTLDEGLGEVRYGKWTGRPMKSLARTKTWADLNRWPSATRIPEGDTLRELQGRAVDETERLRAAHPRDAICCVSHADTIRVILCYYMGLHIDFIHRIWVGPASISVIEVDERGPRVLSMNGLPPKHPAAP